MKDYYDIYYLQNHFNFDGTELSKAIIETFTNRGTDISGADYIFSAEFANSADKQMQWRAFLRKNNLNEPKEFPVVIAHLRHFLEPVVSAIIRQKGLHQKWDFEKKQWF